MAYIEVTEEPESYQQKCLCVLLLDVSGSMADPNKKPKPIDELNKGIKLFHQQIKNDDTACEKLEMCVITFNHNVKCLQEPSLVDNFEMPALSAMGTTKMVTAIREGIKKVEIRKNWYKNTGQPYYRPWIILITDGEPDAGEDIVGVSKELEEYSKNRHFTFFAVGVEQADMSILEFISPNKKGNLQPRKLDGLKFNEFFEWLSNSFSEASKSSHEQEAEEILSYSTNLWESGKTTS